MMKTTSAVIGGILLALSVWILWLIGRWDYRLDANISALFGVAILALAVYARAMREDSWTPLLASAVIASAGLAWGLNGASEWLRPAIGHGFDPKWFNPNVDSLVQTLTVTLLSAHFLLNLADRLIRAAAWPSRHARI